MKFWLPERSVPRRPPVNPRFIWKLLLGIVAAVTGVACLIFCSGIFTIREVRFNGAATIPADALKAIEKSLKGKNLVTLSLARVEKRLRGFPEVQEAVLTRHLFGVLDCSLVKREAVALLARGELVEVDGDGVLIPKRAGGGEVDLPLITGIDGNRAKRNAEQKSLASALEVLSIFKQCGFSPADQISEIHVDGGEVDLVWMGTGTLIKLGRGAFAERIRKLRTVYGVFNENERPPDVIDLRFDRQVVIR